MRQALEVVGFLMIAGAAWFVHPAATLAVVGVSAVWIANYGDWNA